MNSIEDFELLGKLVALLTAADTGNQDVIEALLDDLGTEELRCVAGYVFKVLAVGSTSGAITVDATKLEEAMKAAS